MEKRRHQLVLADCTRRDFEAEWPLALHCLLLDATPRPSARSANAASA